MRSRIVIVTILLSAFILYPFHAMAASANSPSYVVSAEVPGTFTLNLELHKNDISGGIVSSMNFGELVDVGTHTLRSSPTSTTLTGAVLAVLSASTHGAPYTIKQTGTALSSGTSVIPQGACCMKPVYVDSDNGFPIPSGASLGAAGSWVSTDKLIYSSEAGTAEARVVRVYYAISDDPAAGSTEAVPLTHPAGSYSGIITFTATTV